MSDAADVLFEQRLAESAKRVDHMFAVLLGLQWVVGIGVAALLSPYAWAGKTSAMNVHVPLAAGLGFLISSFPIALAVFRPGLLLTRIVIAVAQMFWSALFIHLSGGRIETHFHVFGSLAFLAFYRDWRVLVPATIVVAGDHLVRQLLWPESVYGVLNPEWWRFVEHAGWLVFEDIFLVLSCVVGMREMRDLAEGEVKLKESERIGKEMEIASNIQTSILPRVNVVAGLEIAASMIPATEVGGDYYDVLPVPGGCWIGIGDVSGHGLKAGLVMLQAQSCVEALVAQNPNAAPREVLNATNRVLFQNIRQRLRHDEHMTMSLIRYFEDGRLVITGAHEEPIICRAKTGRCESLPVRGTWLGAKEDISGVTVELTHQLEPGDLFVLYTDGVTEARDGKGEHFGMERLLPGIEAARERSVTEIRDTLLASLKQWTSTQRDDVTLLVLRHHGTARSIAA